MIEQENKEMERKSTSFWKPEPCLTFDISQTFLHNLKPKSVISVIFNGEPICATKEMLQGMYHCIRFDFEKKEIFVDVEVAHYEWLRDKIKGGIFFDVGAATGSFALPMSKYVKHIVAFEPAKTAFEVLKEGIQNNQIKNIDQIPKAAFNTEKEIAFAEYAFTDNCPFLHEASAINENNLIQHESDRVLYNVQTTTLDTQLQTYKNILKNQKVGVKIDVEGSEVSVLEGSREFISKLKPLFIIDIHQCPQNPDITTEEGVKSILEEQGYTFEKLGHVLCCTPIN